MISVYEVVDTCFRLDCGFRFDHMSRSETLMSVAALAPEFISSLLILAMNEIVAQIDKIVMPVPNNIPHNHFDNPSIAYLPLP
jgi:hypothetical protein